MAPSYKDKMQAIASDLEHSHGVVQTLTVRAKEAETTVKAVFKAFLLSSVKTRDMTGLEEDINHLTYDTRDAELIHTCNMIEMGNKVIEYLHSTTLTLHAANIEGHMMRASVSKMEKLTLQVGDTLAEPVPSPLFRSLDMLEAALRDLGDPVAFSTGLPSIDTTSGSPEEEEDQEESAGTGSSTNTSETLLSDSSPDAGKLVRESSPLSPKTPRSGEVKKTLPTRGVYKGRK